MMPCNRFVQWVKRRFAGAHPGNVNAFLEAVCRVDAVEFYESPADNAELMFISIEDREWVRTVPEGCPDTVVVGCTVLIGEVLIRSRELK